MSGDSHHGPRSSRRSFVKAGTGIAASIAVPGLAGPVLAQRGPYGGYLSDVSNFNGTTVDLTGRDEVTISVGADGNNGHFAFAPPAVKVDPGTTVVWEWTGKGGRHNVVHEGGSFESDLVAKKGYTFKRTFEESGVRKYFCRPHKSLGMKGVIAVGDTAQGKVVTPKGSDTGDGGDQRSQQGKPDFGGFLDNVGNYNGNVVDARGRDTVTVEVGAEGNGGNFAFSPPAIHVDTGTTVIWKWTGKGGRHNVVHTGGKFKSKLTAEKGFTFEYTFESDGIYNYYCQPHKGLGMKGSVVVGDDYPTTGGGAETGPSGEAGGGHPPAGGDSVGAAWRELEYKYVMVLAGALGLGAMFVALLPDIAALLRPFRKAVSRTGSRLHALNAFRERLVGSTVLGWITFLVVLLTGAALLAGVWLISPNPLTFLGLLAVLALVVALYATESTGVRPGTGTAASGSSDTRSGGRGGSSAWSAPGNPSGIDVGRAVDVIKGWLGVAALFVVGVAVAVALWKLSGGGIVFLGAVGLAAIVVVAYVLDSAR